jgi:hypothetical protein
MSAPLPACPHLPAPRPGLDWQALHRFRETDRGAEFYHACLEYGQSLWQRRFAARALLCLDRAMGADLRGDEPVLREWPMPYDGMAWLIAPIGPLPGQSPRAFPALRRSDERAPPRSAPLACLGLLGNRSRGAAGAARRSEASRHRADVGRNRGRAPCARASGRAGAVADDTCGGWNKIDKPRKRAGFTRSATRSWDRRVPLSAPGASKLRSRRSAGAAIPP